MYEFSILFFSRHAKPTLIFRTNEDLKFVIEEFITLFEKEVDENKLEIRINPLQANTKDLYERIFNFCKKYKENMPQLNAVNKFFKDMPANELFYVLPNIELDSDQQITLENYLEAINEGKDFQELQSKIKENFSCVLKNYNLIYYNIERPHKIGSNKNDRTCRFCGKQYPDVTFCNTAHAISEALGNKYLILYEECDSCNNFFAENIERDIIRLLQPLNTFFGIKGKKNVPKIKGENFRFEKQDEKILLLKYSTPSSDKEKEVPDKTPLETKNKICLQNIYKALCKFAISLLDVQEVQNFDKTIKWLKGEHQVQQLPYIAVLNSYQFFNKHPNLLLYKRKSDDVYLPYLVGEFHYTFLTYVFIVPFCDKDDYNFIDNNEYNYFWQCFHYKFAEGFTFSAFSDNTYRYLNYNFNFIINPSND